MERLEAIVDAAGISLTLEALLPTGGRPRQLAVRTLLVGMLLAAADDRPAHLVRVHDALVGLDPVQRRRLGVVVDWRAAPTCSPTARWNAPSPVDAAVIP